MRLKAGVTYTFLVDIAYARNYAPFGQYDHLPESALTLNIAGHGRQFSFGSYDIPLWSKVIPMTRTGWQTDTVTFTPTADVTQLQFEATGSIATRYTPSHQVISYGTRGGILLDNLRTLTGIALKKADGTAQSAGKAFRLLWQPILTTSGLDSLARPQLRGTVRTFRGGRVPLPTNLQVTTGKGFYFLQEATPITGQDTLYYGLYVRNTPLVNGAKDDTLRHLYQCRRTFGSQAGLLTGSLQPLTLGSPPTTQRAAPLEKAGPALVPRAAVVHATRHSPVPRRRPAPLTKPAAALPAPRQRGL